MPPIHFPYGIHFLLVTLFFRGANAYTWAFQDDPSQCGQLTVSVSGNDAIPPFRILIAPFGGVNTRKVLDIPFPGTQNEVQFQLTYPAGSQFVAVVSDASGFASGGTGVATTVANSNDSSCFDSPASIQLFVFKISPLVNQVVQCQPVRIWWDPTTVQGTPNFLGIIPGGQSYAIPEPVDSINVDPTGSLGTGFLFTPSLRSGTTILLMGGDARGNGTGGVVSSVIALGNNDASCLSNSSPSSTPGVPAGASTPTPTPSAPGGASASGGGGGGDDGGSSTGSGGGGGHSTSSTNTAAIAGGAVGGGGAGIGGSGGGGGGHSTSSNTAAIAGGAAGGFVGALILVLVVVYFLRRRRRRGQWADHRAGVIDDSAGDPEYPAGAIGPNEHLDHYQPTPLVLDGERYSLGPDSGASPSGFVYTPLETVYNSSVSGVESSLVRSRGKRRGGPAGAPRMVNYVVHSDAGPSVPALELETIEMPPAYADLRRSRAAEEGSSALAQPQLVEKGHII